jgi:hypothetical protein
LLIFSVSHIVQPILVPIRQYYSDRLFSPRSTPMDTNAG